MNADLLHRELVDLASIPGLEARASKLARAVETSALASSAKDVTTLTRRLDEMKAYVEAVRRFLAGAYGKESPEALYYRLPDDALASPAYFTDSITESVGMLDDLSRRVTEEGVRVAGVEQGSAWLVLSTEAPTALTFLGAIRWLFYWQQGMEHKRTVEREQFKSLSAWTEAEVANAKLHEELYRKTAEKMLILHHTSKTKAQLHENVTHTLRVLETLSQHRARGAKLMVSGTADPSLRSNLPREAGGTLPQQAEQHELPVNPSLALPSAPMPVIARQARQLPPATPEIATATERASTYTVDSVDPQPPEVEPEEDDADGASSKNDVSLDS